MYYFGVECCFTFKLFVYFELYLIFDSAVEWRDMESGPGSNNISCIVFL